MSGCEHTIVVYEIVLSLQRLIRKYAHSLHCAEWDVIYAILGNVQDHAIRVHDASPLVKVSPHLLTHPLTHLLTHSPTYTHTHTHSHTHTHTHTQTHTYTHTLTHTHTHSHTHTNTHIHTHTHTHTHTQGGYCGTVAH